MGDLTESLTPSSTTTPTNATPYSRPLPVREDCWSEEATSTLVDAWGCRYLELNRGNLRQKDWQDVADAVNALHAHSKKTHRTDVQSKNRIDTIKKKYKIEKARVVSSNGTLTSPWPFFERMDALIGNNVKPNSNFSPKLSLSHSQSRSPPVAVPLTYRKSVSVNNSNINNNSNSNSIVLTPIPTATAVALPQKRGYNNEGFYRNYSAVAAAAAAVESEEEEVEVEEEENDNENVENSDVKRLAKAIVGFGEVYERVEAEKLRQMVELEKQRMQFASDLEMQRLRIFTEMQVQLERNKRSKRSSSNGERFY